MLSYRRGWHTIDWIRSARSPLSRPLCAGRSTSSSCRGTSRSNAMRRPPRSAAAYLLRRFISRGSWPLDCSRLPDRRLSQEGEAGRRSGTRPVDSHPNSACRLVTTVSSARSSAALLAAGRPVAIRGFMPRPARSGERSVAMSVPPGGDARCRRSCARSASSHMSRSLMGWRFGSGAARWPRSPTKPLIRSVPQTSRSSTDSSSRSMGGVSPPFPIQPHVRVPAVCSSASSGLDSERASR